MEEIFVKDETKLDQLLKIAGLVGTGGEAKLVIQNRMVKINGNVETRRAHKVNDGDIIEYDGNYIKVSIHN
jgi:ribosome-associated protein